jgi:hypothetical protein
MKMWRTRVWKRHCGAVRVLMPCQDLTVDGTIIWMKSADVEQGRIDLRFSGEGVIRR